MSGSRRKGSTPRSGQGFDVRSWPVRTAHRGLLAVAIPLELLAAALVVACLALTTLDAHSLLLGLLLATLAVGFEEAVAHAARMRFRLSAELKQDMQAVWGVAAALALSRGPAVLLVLVIAGYTWFRQQRPAGQVLHLDVFNAANAVISCLSAAVVFDAFSGSVQTGGWAVSESVAAVAAVLVYTVVNRLFPTCALLAMRKPVRSVLGSRDDNLVELATLCLGALVALAVVHAPLLAVLVLAPMITLQRGAVVRELEAAATTDAKTGLLNAVAWEQVATRELERAGRDRSSIAVLIIDIDRFKNVNDKFGHLAGDRVLRLVGRALAAGVREYDTVARFGGEEFVAVLPEATADVAVAVAERLRMRVHELRMSLVVAGLTAESDEQIAVSIGVVAAEAAGVEVHDLLHLADSALYRAKAAGRNCVVLADQGGEQEFSPAPVT